MALLPGAGMPVSPLVSPAPEPAPGVSPDGGPSGVSTGAAAHTARDSVHSRHQSQPRRHITAAVRRHVWLRDGGRCCYRDPPTGRRRTSSHLLQTNHLLPVAEGGGPNLFNLHLLRFPITAYATATGRLCRRDASCSASSALLARALDSARRRLARGRGRAGHPSYRRARSVHLRLAAASSDPGRGLPPTNLPLPAIGTIANHRQRSALQHR